MAFLWGSQHQCDGPLQAGRMQENAQELSARYCANPLETSEDWLRSARLCSELTWTSRPRLRAGRGAKEACVMLWGITGYLIWAASNVAVTSRCREARSRQTRQAAREWPGGVSRAQEELKLTWITAPYLCLITLGFPNFQGSLQLGVRDIGVYAGPSMHGNFHMS